MTGAGATLMGMTKQLSNQWEVTKESWADAKSAEFEARFLSEMFSAVDKAVVVMEELDKVVRKIRTDCE